MSDSTTWNGPVGPLLNDASSAGVICFPVYRPDLAKQIASDTNYAFYDFRDQYMSGYGKDADGIPLRNLDAQIHAVSAAGPVIFHNAEALLAGVDAHTRGEWIKAFLQTQWPNKVLLPLYLFGDQLADDHPNVAILDYALLPEQSLISRMAN